MGYYVVPDLIVVLRCVDETCILRLYYLGRSIPSVLAVLSLQWSTCFLRVIRPAVVSDDGRMGSAFVGSTTTSWRCILLHALLIITVRNKTCTCTRGQSRTDTTHERPGRGDSRHHMLHALGANRLDRRGRRRERERTQSSELSARRAGRSMAINARRSQHRIFEAVLPPCDMPQGHIALLDDASLTP